MAAPSATSMGEKQTIQARHGVATFVPKGHTIKIINTYGKQVVDTWAFALHAPPEDEDIHKEEGKEKKKAEEKAVPVKEKKKEEKTPVKKDVKERAAEASSSVQKTTEKVTEKAEDVSDETSEKVTEKVEPSASKKGWSSYIPSVRGRSKAPVDTNGDEQDEAEKSDEMAKSWSAYLPSLSSKAAPPDNTNSQSKGWSSYIPTGVGYSSYMPAKGTLSAFASSHTRDPTKSYAEQLYDFSKTPVGAAGLSGK
jgi:hypothetical protein